jgi:hypothetical protein
MKDITTIKNELVQKLQELRDTPPAFISVSKDSIDQKALDKFVKSHKHKGKDTGAIGGKFSYTVTGTGLGQCVSITCNICGKTQDLTNFDNW